MESASFIDPYLYPDSGILINIPEIKDIKIFESAEADLVSLRVIEYMEQNRLYNVDKFELLTELQAIHHHLFQDIYKWAGETRTVDIRKNVEGADFFLPVSMVERASANVTQEIISENLLVGLNVDQFIERLTYYYDQINYIHPFREGNGRTQRILLDNIVKNAGYKIDWLKITGEINNNASKVAAKTGDRTLLLDMFAQIVKVTNEN